MPAASIHCIFLQKKIKAGNPILISVQCACGCMCDKLVDVFEA